MTTIETKTVANVNEIVDIITKLNYKGETFEYENTSTFDDNSKGRFFGSVRKNGNPGGFSILEIFVDDELKAVRFFNHYKDITVEFKLGDFAPSYDRFDNVIEIPANQPANVTAAETDGSEDDTDEDIFNLLPARDELNDVNDNPDNNPPDDIMKKYKGVCWIIKHRIAKNGRHMWFAHTGIIGKVEAAERLNKFGLTIEQYLAAEEQEEAQWAIERELHLEAYRHARHIEDKINRECKPIDNDNPFDFLPSLDELNDVDTNEQAAEVATGYIFTVYENGKVYNTACATLGDDIYHEVINFAPYIDICDGWELKTTGGDIIIKGNDAPDFTEIVLAVAATLSTDKALQILENEAARLNRENKDLGKEIDFGLFLYGASPEEVEDSFTRIADNRDKIAAIANQIETLKAAIACDPCTQTTAETDGSEDDRDNEDAFAFLPTLDELNDVDTPEAEDKVITAEVKQEDNFSAKLAELQAKRDAAQAALLKAQEEHENAERLLQEFLSDTAGNLATQLHELNNTLDYSIELVTKRGYSFTVSDFDNIYTDSFGNGKTFAFNDWRGRKYAAYDTPAQIEKVIAMLKAAIERGDEKFTFPTVDELNAVNEDKTALADSLNRAMKTALANYQNFCRAKNLTGAEDELKLYNICRKAMSELWRR